MPEARTLKKAKEDKRAGKSASTQAGEFVKEQIDKVRAGKHGVRSSKQAVAIGLSEARRAGVKLEPPAKKASKTSTRKHAEKDLEAGKAPKAPSKTRSKATKTALKRESTDGASTKALSTQAKKAASKRSSGDRSAAAKKAAETKGAAGRSAAAKKAAETRARNRKAAG